ncbi:hypothetical protein [Moraxella sp.]|uniref:hypothetical protein n=1 Tax=Moraxella sp. TaxID=479 RepID=UPI0026DB45CE|nr:hypothetical protein [Moraxella sp.]MDO4895252.1 hypothetical protein [Moraxella sp.]
MTDRLDELLKRQFAREAARQNPQGDTIEEVLARSRETIKKADCTVAKYHKSVSYRSTAGSLVNAAASGALSVLALASVLLWLFVIIVVFGVLYTLIF